MEAGDAEFLRKIEDLAVTIPFSFVRQVTLSSSSFLIAKLITVAALCNIIFIFILNSEVNQCGHALQLVLMRLRLLSSVVCG